MNKTYIGILIPIIVLLLFDNDPQASTLTNSQQENRDSLAAASMNKAATNVLKPVYPYLARYITDTFSLQDKRGVGIDVGGGPGSLVAELCKYTDQIYWTNADINPWYLPYVNQKAQNNNCIHRIAFIKADATDLPFKDDFAEVIVSRASFHFWDNMEKGFSEVKRVLKPDGKAIIGRGLPPNMPTDTARAIREKQNHRITGYEPEDFADDFKKIMNKLKIKDYKIIIPKPEASVQYGIWIIFSK